MMSTLPIGLTYYYRMDTLGGVVNAADPGVGDLSQSGNPGLVAGKIGSAFNYPSESHSHSRSSSGPQWLSPAAVGEAHFTVAAWVNIDAFIPESPGVQCVIVEGAGSTESAHRFQLGFEISTQRAYFLGTQSNNSVRKVFHPTALSTGVWYLLVGRIDGTTGLLSLSVDGGTANTISHDGSTETDPTEQGRVARHNTFGNAGLEGSADEIAIWSGRAISDDEVVELWNDGDGITDLLALPVTALWFDDAWAARNPLTIPASQVPSTQTDYTVLISIVDPDLSLALANGDDILFTDDTGANQLSHTIVSFDPGTGTLIAHVNIPDLDDTEDTTIYIYYGNPASPNQEDPAGTWPSHYVGVWHLEEDPTAGAPQFVDSTVNNNDGTAQGGMVAGDQVPGQVGGSIVLDDVDDHVSVPDSASLSPTAALTLTAWLNLTGIDTVNIIASKWDYGSDASWSVEIRGGGTQLFGFIASSPTDLGGNGGFSNGTWPGSGSGWHHFAMVYDGAGATDADRLRFYVDGVFVAMTGFVGSIPAALQNSAAPLRIGHWNITPVNQYFGGGMDEVRMSNIARSADSIQIEYNNESAPGTFVTVGAQESQGAGGDGAFHQSVIRRRRRTA